MVERWWTFEHFYMPEGIPLTTLIKVIIGAIGACQMPSLPSQLPRSPWTQLHTPWQELGGRREVRPRTGPHRPPSLRRRFGESGVLTIWNASSVAISRHGEEGQPSRVGWARFSNTQARLYPRSRWLMFDPLRRAHSVRSVVSHN